MSDERQQDGEALQVKRRQKECKHLSITRLSRDLAECDFRYGHDPVERVRGFVSIRLLGTVVSTVLRGKMTETEILTLLAEGRRDSNLAPGAQPMKLKTFMLERFLPKKKVEVHPSTYSSACDEMKRLTKSLGKVPIHEIHPRHAEAHKAARRALGIANVSIKHDLITLGEAMNHAVALGLVRQNPLLPVRNLPTTDRTSIWLRLKDIPRLMRSVPRQIKPLIYFQILTGARINEALATKTDDVDWNKGIIWILNSKRRRRSRAPGKKKRALRIDDLGPRFRWLLEKFLECGPDRKKDAPPRHLFPGRFPGVPLSIACADRLFREAVKRAKLGYLIPKEVIESGGHDHLVIHDLRGGFINHGAIAEWSFQKLRAYTGQINAASIQAYLDEADGIDPAESIFRHHPLRVRRASQQEAPTPAMEPVTTQEHVQPPANGFPTQPFLH